MPSPGRASAPGEQPVPRCPRDVTVWDRVAEKIDRRRYGFGDGRTPGTQGAPEKGDGATGRQRLRWVLLVVIGVLSIATLALFAVPELSFVERAPNVDVAMSMATTLAALAISILAWVRHGEGERHAVYEAGAFLALFVGGALEVILVLVGLDRQAGTSLDAPGPAPFYLH